MMNKLGSAALRQAHALKFRRFFSTKELIINAVGSDRVGIVSDMTKYVTGVGGNVGESQASRLGNHFSLMMLVNVPEKRVVELVNQLEDVEDITASVHMVKQDAKLEPVSKAAIGYTGRFSLEGTDNPGIVHRVTSIFASNGLSIDKMETSDYIAPYGGVTLFKMVGIAHAYEPLAAGFDAEKIKSELGVLGDELNCDIEMEDAKPGETELESA
mmetsp:Transcript_92684/g.267649  ORF Transcript_92684/g.267649 Transcript_92684/m.267649 type:complete len:214 (+) Transcript_92684:90-731(+)